MIARFTLVVTLLLGMPPGLAWAHAMLVSATPAVGSTVAVAPAELVLRYTDMLDLRFCAVTVQDAAGARVDRGNLRIGPDSGKTLAVGLADLPPGEYRVRWQVQSVDGHRTEGSFRFAIAPR